jgi:hypothetical protein
MIAETNMLIAISSMRDENSMCHSSVVPIRRDYRRISNNEQSLARDSSPSLRSGSE